LENEPVIRPWPFVIGCWMTGAEMTLLSTTIASCWFTIWVVTSPNVFAPEPVIWKSISHPVPALVWLPVL
jgi:hypothetical protein